MGKRFRLYQLFVVVTLLVFLQALSAGPLFAQMFVPTLPTPTPSNHYLNNRYQNNHYLNTVPIPQVASAQGFVTLPQLTQSKLPQPKRTISLAEVSASAYNHPGVQQARLQAEALRGAVIQAGLRENPALGYSAEDMVQGHAGTQGIIYNQPVTPKHVRNARQMAAYREWQSALQLYQIQHQKAVNDALLLTYKVSFSYQKCLVLEELAMFAKEARDVGEELLKAGEISRPLFLDVKIQFDLTLIDLRDAEIAYRAVCKELAILLQLPVTELFEVTDALDTVPPEVDESVLLAQILATSPEIQRAHAEVAVAQGRLRLRRAESGIHYDFNAGIAYNSDSKETEYSVGVAVPLRIFDRNQGNIQQAKMELAAARRNVERWECLLATKYERQLADYLIARNRVTSYRDILDESREALDLILASYRLGEAESLELLEAQRGYSTVRLGYLTSMQALMESQVLLQGALLSGGWEMQN